jgi:hypothetical protein
MIFALLIGWFVLSVVFCGIFSYMQWGVEESESDWDLVWDDVFEDEGWRR